MKADFIIKNAMVYMTIRQCFEKRDVAVAGEKIFAVSPALSYPGVNVIDAEGKYLIPGLIDIHMHIESSMTYPMEFSRITLPYGVTTVVADAHEIANVFGLEGVRWFMDQQTEQDIFYAIPSSVPATTMELETSGAQIGERETAFLADDDRVLCLGEVMNFKDLTSEQDTLTKRLVNLCRRKGAGRALRIEGHCPKITGEDLCRFVYAGVDADHTQQSPESVLEKTDLGMFLELQHKSLTKEVVEVVCSHGLYENVALITDDTMPDTLLKGHLNQIVSHAVRMGMPVEKAIYCATYTPARRMHLDDRGFIGPGKLADLVLLNDLETFVPYMVFKNGRCVFEQAQDSVNTAASVREARKEAQIPEHFRHSVVCRRAVQNDFILRAGKNCRRVRANVIEIQKFGNFTRRVEKELNVKDGVVCWQEAGLCLAVIFERHGKNGNVAYGLIDGAFCKPGAAATTWSHDSHNLFVLGNSPEDMVIAQNRILELQGGYVTASEGKLLAEACLPVGGIISDRSVEKLADQLSEVRASMSRLGYENNNEIMSMSTLALPVSPELKMTDFGLLDVRSQEKIPLIEEFDTDEDID